MTLTGESPSTRATGLGLLVPLAEARLDLGCSRLDPGEANHRWLPMAVAALPPRSSAGRHCCSGWPALRWLSVTRLVAPEQIWASALPCPFLVGEVVSCGASVAVDSSHMPHQSLLLGPSKTGHRSMLVEVGVYWRWQDGIRRADVMCCHDSGSLLSVC